MRLVKRVQIQYTQHNLRGWFFKAHPVYHVTGSLVGQQEGHPACKKMGDGGGGHWLVRMEWRPAGWLVCLSLLIFPCTIKSRSSLLAPAHPGGSGKRAVKRLWWWWWCSVHIIYYRIISIYEYLFVTVCVRCFWQINTSIDYILRLYYRAPVDSHKLSQSAP